MAPADPHRHLALGLGATVAIGAAVVLAVLLSGRPPAGPVPVQWDRTRCARCGMLISEPRFAAQLHADDGEVRFYDDPGCLLADLADEPGTDWHAAWLHHAHEDRWIRLENASFVSVPHSPMGYGLGAVTIDEGALDLAAAHARVAAILRDGGAAR